MRLPRSAGEFRSAGISTIVHTLASRGFEVRRHPAARRQRLLDSAGVNLVIDVGAAVGHYGHELREFGYRGEIVSFEPLAAPFAKLAAEAALDPKWQARNSALGSKVGTATINVASNSDSSSLLPMLEEHREAAPHIAYVGSEEIQISTLDAEFADATDDTRAFLKIDTQGFEAEVLAGGEKFLNRCAGLQIELSFRPLYEGGLLAHETIAAANDLGFTLVGFQQGFAAPSGEILQADGTFFRTETLEKAAQ